MELPDFDYMDTLAKQAAIARKKIKMLEAAKERMAAIYMRTALVDRSVWIHGKYPTGVVLEKIFAKVGITPEDLAEMERVSNEIAWAYADFEEAIALLQTCRDKIALYQTESANQRVGIGGW